MDANGCKRTINNWIGGRRWLQNLHTLGVQSGTTFVCGDQRWRPVSGLRAPYHITANQSRHGDIRHLYTSIISCYHSRYGIMHYGSSMVIFWSHIVAFWKLPAFGTIDSPSLLQLPNAAAMPWRSLRCIPGRSSPHQARWARWARWRRRGDNATGPKARVGQKVRTKIAASQWPNLNS